MGFVGSRRAEGLKCLLRWSGRLGQVLSREVTQPPFQGPVIIGEQRGQFTVGVEGCGQRQTYQVFCPMGGDGCFAAEGRDRLLR